MSRLGTLGLLVAAGLAAGYVESATRGDPAPRLDALRRRKEQLHARLDRNLARDPVVARALAEPDPVVIVVRVGLIEDLTARVAHRYLRQVTVDLKTLRARSGGTLRRRTPLGRRKVGAWRVEIVVRELVGELRAGRPRLSLAGTALVVELPVEVQPAAGRIGLHFAWDSASLANLVCADFEIDLDVAGRALLQKQVLRGRIELTADNDTLSATPVVDGRRFRLRVALEADSWRRIEAALRAQDVLGRCGLFLDPERVLTELRAIVARGLELRLPRALFPAVRLPARFAREVRVDEHVVRLALSGERLRAGEALLWSSVKVSVASAAPAAP